MQNVEMGKFMVWLLGIFPNWQPDKGVALAWAEELPDLTAEQAKNLVRKLNAKKPSPFPPSVFELLAELRGSKKLDARRIWVKVLDCVKSKGRHAYPYDLTVEEQHAVRLIGGVEVIASAKDGDAFLEKRFLEVWENLTEEKAQLAIAPNFMRQIGKEAQAEKTGREVVKT